MSELTTASAWIAGLAIVALIAAGWRKPARASAATAREGRRSRPAVELSETEAELHRRSGLWRRLWAVAASGGLAVVIGAVLATLVSFGVAYTVIRLTDMLRR